MADAAPPGRASPRPLAGCARLPDGRLRSGTVGSVAFRSVFFGGVVEDERNFRHDRTSSTHAGGSSDPPLLAHHHSPLPARRLRLRGALRQTSRPTGWPSTFVAISSS